MRRIREIVIAANVDVGRRFHERPDLVAVEAAVTNERKWCTFVAVRDLNTLRLDREGQILFAEFLAEHDVDLVLANEDEETVKLRMHAALLRAIAEEQRAGIAEVGRWRRSS